MPLRTSTLLRENAIDCGSWPKLSTSEKKEVEEIQKRILYEGNPELFNTCIICDKKASKRGDHLISAVNNKNARFRDGKILATGHPLNKVFCCSGGCNNEKKKQIEIEKKPRLKAYYDYVLQHIPTVNITEEEFAKLNEETIENEKKRLSHVNSLLNR
jgi:hypothetical protein